MKTEVLARDSLKNKTNQMFTVLYEVLLYLMVPIAFEMSFVKIFQRSMEAYELNDLVAITRLTVYLVIQWFLGVLVRRDYLKATLKRITLAVMILVQAKEAFYEEVLFDMIVSMMLESGLIVLMFFKFFHLVVILKIVGLGWIVLGASIILVSYLTHFEESDQLNHSMGSVNRPQWMHRIRYCYAYIYRGWYGLRCYMQPQTHQYNLRLIC